MKPIARLAGLLAIITLALACNGARSVPEKSAALRGKIVGRDEAHNLLTVDHEKVGEMMDPMTMPYFVKGAKVAQLPPDGARITATLHEQEGEYWLSDVRSAP